MNRTVIVVSAAALLASLSACGRGGEESATQTPHEHAADGAHTHADGTAHTHEGMGHDHDHDHEHDHDHDEVDLGTFEFGDPPLRVTLAQAHGKIEPGKEGHLVVKLPYNDGGATTVRAWLGIEDRTLSYVGRGEYSASHDDYDIHAMAPDPLPENTMWWIEIEQPDGTKVIGSARPLMD